MEPQRIAGLENDMLSFALYLIGSVVCIAGTAWIASLLGAAPAHVTAAAALLLAVSVVLAGAHARAIRPPPH